ncbi:MAG: glycosyltransferase [Flavobacteriaceae bacterium]
MILSFSIIIPVYNRPYEVKELLDSLLLQTYQNIFEIIIVEDGSKIKSNGIVNSFKDKLNITYLFKENSGPGESRNEGMKIAKGNYFIILDSDVILPNTYIQEVDNALNQNFTDAYAGADKAHKSFSGIQKAINFAMTSFITTGGLRNNKGNNTFQLRSFNMGLSKKAFQLTDGFAKQYIGEDIDLNYKLDALQLNKQFILKGYVYHKRRVNFKQFYNQTNNFGRARPLLNKMHKNSSKFTYWFPSLFIIFFISSLIGLLFGISYLFYLFGFYFMSVFVIASINNNNAFVGLLSVLATIVQFFGYGIGFLQSQFKLKFLKKSNKETFPKMFS